MCSVTGRRTKSHTQTGCELCSWRCRRLIVDALESDGKELEVIVVCLSTGNAKDSLIPLFTVACSTPPQKVGVGSALSEVPH